jgi:hypothetical protein
MEDGTPLTSKPGVIDVGSSGDPWVDTDSDNTAQITANAGAAANAEHSVPDSVCRAIADSTDDKGATVTDEWCVSNCGHRPPNCPEDQCSCS